MTIELSAEEVRDLIRILESHLSETYSEVRRTSTPDYHDELIDQRHRLQEVVRRLHAAVPA